MKGRYRTQNGTTWKDNINVTTYNGYTNRKTESFNSTDKNYVLSRSEGNFCQPNYQKNLSHYRKELCCEEKGVVQYIMHDVKNEEDAEIYAKKAYNLITKPTNTILANDIKYSSTYKEYLRKNNLTYEQNLYDHSFNCIKPDIKNESTTCNKLSTKKFQIFEANKYPNLKRYNNQTIKCNNINTRQTWGPITSSGLITEKKYAAIKSNIISNNKNCSNNEFFDFNKELLNKQKNECFVENKCKNLPGTGNLKNGRGAKARILK
tara:strand:+ start:2474 stop:3262 length:789 start_codon:yes stop_codon:yes gene_type:complete